MTQKHNAHKQETHHDQASPSSMERIGGGKWLRWATAILTALLAVIAGLYVRGRSALSNNHRDAHNSILRIFARNAFDWGSSTTPAPLSATAVLVKKILADKRQLPPGLESAILTVTEAPGFPENGSGSPMQERVVDVQVAAVRNFVSHKILHEVKQLCGASGDAATGCDANEVDPEFGTTPLHLAELWGNSELAEYLVSIGADPGIYDGVGRQPRNMTFKAFNSNSKKAGEARLLAAGGAAKPEDRCEIPEVVIPLEPIFPDITASNKNSDNAAAVLEWQRAAHAALSEVRRLVSEGEPVMVRNAVPWLLAESSSRSAAAADLSAHDNKQSSDSSPLQYPNAAAFAEAWGHRPVDVGGVPYAKNFDLWNKRTTLQEYITATAATTAATETHATPPNYVFQVDTEACVEGRELLGRIVDAALPSSGDRPMVCPPASGLRGLESVHYYLGGRDSGAPFHIHSDAINMLISGTKKWWVVTPGSAVWSRRHIREYAEERKGGPWRGDGAGKDSMDFAYGDRPMECVQRAGDMVYVPGDWGHAAMNLEDGTFG